MDKKIIDNYSELMSKHNLAMAEATLEFIEELKKDPDHGEALALVQLMPKDYLAATLKNCMVVALLREAHKNPLLDS